jgi:hypothetical protein
LIEAKIMKLEEEESSSSEEEDSKSCGSVKDLSRPSSRARNNLDRSIEFGRG